jgi:hypothetical protein
MTIFTGLLTPFMGFTLIVLRAHYTIDILSGIIFAHYVYIMSTEFYP